MLIERNGQILKQLRALETLASEEVLGAEASWAFEEWRNRLISSFANNTALARTLTNVDTSAPKATRVTSMWSLLGQCVDDLDAKEELAVKRRIESFLLHVAWHEGAKLTARTQAAQGPARSFFQFEAFRAKEALLYADKLKLMPKLATVSGEAEAKLKTACDGLPTYGDPSDSWFPKGNLIQDLLLRNDLFGIYLARIAFKNVPAAIPASNTDQAAYWYKYWKVSGGDEVTLKRTFKAEADEVDALIPATSRAT